MEAGEATRSCCRRTWSWPPYTRRRKTTPKPKPNTERYWRSIPVIRIHRLFAGNPDLPPEEHRAFPGGILLDCARRRDLRPRGVARDNEKRGRQVPEAGLRRLPRRRYRTRRSQEDGERQPDAARRSQDQEPDRNRRTSRRATRRLLRRLTPISLSGARSATP